MTPVAFPVLLFITLAVFGQNNDYAIVHYVLLAHAMLLSIWFKRSSQYSVLVHTPSSEKIFCPFLL
jgi:hypothetical protein